MNSNWLRDVIYRVAESFPADSWLNSSYSVKAFIAVVLVGVICGSVGPLVVGNRMAFFSDALAHCAIAGVSFGVLVALTSGRGDLEAWLVPVVMVAFGAAFGCAIAYVRENSALASDTVIGVFFALAVGAGAMLLAAISRSSFKNAESLLFGSPMTVYEHELAVLVALAVGLGAMLVLSYNSIVLASFNASLARSRGVRVRLWNYAFIVLLAVVVNLCLKAVGALLINALLIVPAAAAANLGRNIRSMYRWAVAVSLAAGVGGLWLSNSYELPLRGGDALPLSPSGTIVLLCVAAFFASLVVRMARDRRRPAPATP